MTKFGDCPKCVEHFLELRSMFGDQTAAAFIAVARQNGTHPVATFKAYMVTNHRLGHPDDEACRQLLETFGYVDPAAPEAPDPIPRKTARHVYEPAITVGSTKADMCGYGALLGSDAFCGRPHDDKVHSILCPQCERRSRSADDIRDGYCGHCKARTSEPL